MNQTKLPLASLLTFTAAFGVTQLVAQDGNAAITTETFVRPPA